MTTNKKLTDAWQALAAHRQMLRDVPLTQLFDDEKRFENFSVQLPGEDGDGEDERGVLLDYSKTAVAEETMDLLAQLADAADVAGLRDAMFAGEAINRSEERAVLHTALRADEKATVKIGGKNIIPEVIAARELMLAEAETIRGSGRFSDVVNIGIGGSDLGPAMATAALSPDNNSGMKFHFVSNIDGAALADTLAPLDARRTLIIVSSKTFTTMETLTNAARARDWLRATVSDKNLPQHLIAVTAAPAQTKNFSGIGKIFAYWDWVGGRYSLWGAVGLPIALAVGAKNFGEFLRGAREADAHFRTAPLRQNLPLLWGLLGVWHRNICGYPTRAVLPYSHRLARLPDYLQQLDMESNGKQVRRDGTAAAQATAPVVWGGVGTNAQHAFFQMLHQGTDVVPCEFWLAALPRSGDDEEQHRLLLANGLAQSTALLRGRDDAAAPPHRRFTGGRPSLTLMYRKLTPRTLGRLVALCEHRTFTEGALWGINSFDQWGVELGKIMSRDLHPHLPPTNTPTTTATPPATAGPDPITRPLLTHHRTLTNSPK